MKICPKCRDVYPEEAAFCPFDGTALSKPENPWIGWTLAGRYQIVEKIGEGGMGHVFRAIQFHPERHVAIKVLPKDCLGDASMRERFNREGMAVAMIQHQHIVNIFDAGETENRIPYLVMELLSGESLSDVIAGGPMDAARTVAILMQVCEALGPVHAMGIIHRDLKPGNIFIEQVTGYVDFVKILDFGIALLIDKPRLTDKNLVVGTPEYIAPEQILGRSVGPPADFYSLGCIAYEMLSGRTPFGDASASDLLLKHVHEMPAPLHEAAAGLPVNLCDIIMRLLQKDPQSRYPDAYVLIKDLDALGLDRKVEPAKAAARDTGLKKRPDQQIKEISPAGDSSVKWKNFVSSAKNKLPETREIIELVGEMEKLSEDLEKIEDELAGLSGKIEKIESSGSETKSRLRHALEALAKELSEKRTASVSMSIEIAELDANSLAEENRIKKILGELSNDDSGRLSYDTVCLCREIGHPADNWCMIYRKVEESLPAKEKADKEVEDLEYQIHQMRKRIESIDRESPEDKKRYELRLGQLEADKMSIKDKLVKISSIVAKQG